MLPYLESWHFTPWDERLTSAWSQWETSREQESERAREREREVPAKSGMEKGGKNKGKGEWDGEFHVNSICRDSCHRVACSLETLRDSSVKRAAPAPVFVCDCVREQYKCKHMSLWKRVWAHLCKRLITFLETLSSLYLHFFMLSLHLLHVDYCTLNFCLKVLFLQCSNWSSYRYRLIQYIESPYKPWNIWRGHANSWHYVPMWPKLQNHSEIQYFPQNYIVRVKKATKMKTNHIK